MLVEWLMKCDACNGKGTVRNMGMLEKKCSTCRFRRKIASITNDIKNWVISNPFKTTPVGVAISFFVIMFFITYFYPHEGSLSVLVASFGAVFVALKYKLDQTSYHKNLFEERYAVFLKIDKILSDFLQGKNKDGIDIDWRSLKEETDSFYRKSYFLFSKKTYCFIDKFQQAITNATFPDGEMAKKQEAQSFLISLVDSQNLFKNFPELKIDRY